MPANAAVPQRRRIERVRRTERRPATPEAWARILFVPPPLLMMLFLVALVLPVGISVAGLQLTPYTCVLLVFLAPAILYWLQHAPRVIALDIFMMLYILWIGVAIYHNHGNSRLVFIVNQSVTLFGAYLLGRVLVRDPASHRLMFSCLFWILLVLFPFAVFELIFNKSIIQTIFGLPHSSAGMRLGMRRVLSVFPHPILFGVFCSIMVSNFFYIFYERTRTRMGRTLLAVAMTFMSLSTGPNLAQLGQLILIAWERLFRFFVTKWYVLVVAAASLLSIGQMAYPGGIYAFIVENLAFNQHSGWGRMEILVYGSQIGSAEPDLRHRAQGLERALVAAGLGRQLLAGDRDALRDPGARLHLGRARLARGADHQPQRTDRTGGELPQGLRLRRGRAGLRAGLGAHLGCGRGLRHVLHRGGRLVLHRRCRARAGPAARAIPYPAAAHARSPDNDTRNDTRGRASQRGRASHPPPSDRETGSSTMKLKGLNRLPPNAGEIGSASLPQSGRMLMDLLTARERRGFYILALVMLLVGIFETAGIASILPFMAVLAEPSRIEHTHRLAVIYHGLGFTSVGAFLVLLGFATFLLTMVGIVMHILSIYSISRFTSQCSYMLSCQLLQGYLGQPYSWFLNRHSADLGKAVLSEVDNVVSQSFVPAMNLLANLLVALFIAAFLILLQPWVALGTAVVLVASYGVIFLIARRYLTRFGQIRFAANAERYKIAQEATAGIKDVKLLGLEARYVRRFQNPARRLARVSATRNVIASAPRYLLQGVAFGGMLLIILGMLLAQSASLGAILPLLAVYAFAGLRLLPAVQQIYEQITSLRYNQPALLSLHKDITSFRVRDAQPVEVSREPVHLRERLELTDVRFSYPLAEREALQGLTLSIPARTTVGIVGGTGAGKTTAVDLMLGLLDMQQGTLAVDGQPITPRNVRAWQDTIGYVPQHIFLTDDTVAANIAFGQQGEQIDRAAVERASRIAELHAFVIEELPQGYDTMVGERGIRLSGGQRQRIGIARALYHDPDILIMDEATSALDNLTERAVMDAVHNLGHAKTIILIAHRLTTVQACETIFMLEQGKLVAQGSYNELLDTSRKFRAMAVGHAAG